MIPDWLRKYGGKLADLLGFSYGNCCGAGLDCSRGDGRPVDQMCEACMEHDMNLYAAKQMDTEQERKLAKMEADIILGDRLRDDLRPYAKWDGPLKNKLFRMVFK